MQEAEEQDTCRICSAPAEPDQPLFYPCKCSGTIRYIHQDCLTTWLSHSKKKTCDVCKHPYSFTKVYAPDMPSRLPPVLLIRRLAQQSFFVILFGIRAAVVGTIWLAVLPWATVWTWRMYFSMGDSTAWWISKRDRPTSTGPRLNPFYYNVPLDTSLPPPTTYLGYITSHPIWLALSADIFTGQIIASIIVLTFVAIFLLREWISQNARPGVFEDDEIRVVPEERPVNAVALAQQPIVPNPDVNERLAFAQRQFEAMRQLDELRAREGTHGHLVGEGRNHGRTRLDDLPAGFDKANTEDEDRFEVARAKRRQLRHLDEQDPADPNTTDLDEQRLQRRNRRINAARLSGARRRLDSAASSSGPVANSPQRKFEFTFRADSPLSAGAESSSSQRSASEPPKSDFSFGSTQSSSAPTTPVFPPVTLQPPRGSIPYAINRIRTESEASVPSTSASASTSTPVRRPPLPSTLPATPNASLPASPLISPSLATYRAPEELDDENEAGPSIRGYFGSAEAKADDGGVASEDFDKYFPESADTRSDGELDEEEETLKHDSDAEENPALNGHAARVLDVEFLSDDEGDEAGMPELEPVDMDREDEEDDDDDDEEEEEEGILGQEDDEEGNWDGMDSEDEAEVEEPAAGGVGGFVGGDAVDVGGDEVPGPLVILGEPGDQDAMALADLNDDLEGNVEDDMDGAMEAIGMRGPIYGVVQNAALMIFVLDTAIGIGIWIPFTIGKSTALLSLDPRRFFQILHFPIQAIRIITDPIVDGALYVLVDFLLPPYINIGRRTLQWMSRMTMSSIGWLFGEANASKTSAATGAMYSRALHVLHSAPLHIMSSLSGSVTTESGLASPPSSFDRIVSSVIEAAEPYFAVFGQEIRITFTQVQEIWAKLALGHGPKEKVFAILLGYAVVVLLLALYLNILTVGNMRTAGRAVRTAVRQQLLVLKVATFIFIELATFPLGCGIVLDLCTVWLFPDANIATRVAFFYHAPLTATFYHWVGGTMFMYAFAILLSGCRSIMRPGAMWFIKDPQDQNSHPIREILDRPALTQLRKICVSGLMYSFVVVLVVASIGGLLLLGSKSIMPFRWKNREPLSDVPIDLIFLHLALPYTMHYFRPKKALKKASTTAWSYLAAKLRLTSYFLGERRPEEEYSSEQWIINPFSQRSNAASDEKIVRDGSFRRVPATDHLALPRDMRATAAVTEAGEPVDDVAKDLMAKQNHEAEKAKRDITMDYMTVYIPPRFPQRIILFITSMWIVGALSMGVVVALPILLGRGFFKLFLPRDVHDGYSFLIGFYMLWACFIIGKAVDRLDKRRQRRSGDGPRGDLRVLVIKRGLLWIAKICYMTFFLGVVIPTLLSFVMELYVVLPIRLALHPDLVPRIRVVDNWALGLLYMKIGLHITRVQPENNVAQGIRHINHNGWTHPEPITATKEVIGPAIGGLVGMILLPGLLFRLVRILFPFLALNDKFLFMHVYPAIFAGAALSRSAIVLFDMLITWSQSVRDKEFLVEMRLRNHEPEKKRPEAEMVGRGKETDKPEEIGAIE